MKIIFSILFFFFSMIVIAQPPRGVTNNELKALVGNWAGSMVYTDYNKGISQVTLQTQLEIVDMKDSLALNFIYTEPNGKKVIEKKYMRIYEEGNKLSFDSAQFDIMEIRRRGVRLTIIAEREGADNFRSADFMQTIIIGPGILNITKEVRYRDMVEYSIRYRLALKKL